MDTFLQQLVEDGLAGYWPPAWSPIPEYMNNFPENMTLAAKQSSIVSYLQMLKAHHLAAKLDSSAAKKTRERKQGITYYNIREESYS